MLFSSLSTVIRRRHTSKVVACAIVLSLSPVMLFGGSAAAEVAGVTGLAQGTQGDAVRAVQQALVNQGIAVAGGVDGVFGSATVSALKQFQTRNGLNATGVVDAATALALGLTTSPLLGLTQGAQGEAVRQLQQRLIDIGIPVNGGADGVFGPGTTTAVKEFQGRPGVLQDRCRQCGDGGRRSGRRPPWPRRLRRHRRRRPLPQPIRRRCQA